MNEKLVSRSISEYRGFTLISSDLENPVINYKHRVVTVNPLNAPGYVVSRLSMLMLENGKQYFTTKKEAKEYIQLCYK